MAAGAASTPPRSHAHAPAPTPTFAAELMPGRGLGPFVLGMPLLSGIAAVRERYAPLPRADLLYDEEVRVGASPYRD